MKALITGITGFAGSHLAEYLLSRGDVEVYGTYRLRSRMEHIQHLLNKVELVECELKDPHSVNRMINEIRPDLIFHLAAQSFVPTSWNSPTDTLTNNIVSQVNIFEAVRKYDFDCKIQIACSSEEYGMVYPEETAIKETNPLRPLSPYAVSKVAQDFLGYQYYQSYGMKIVRTRTFNHTGPRRGEHFVTSNFAKQISKIELGLQQPKLLVGNLQAKRDFTDVRDVVRAYWLSLEKGEPGEVYNIAAGTAVTIDEMLQTLLSFTDAEIEIEVDPSRLRPSDVEILLGDSSVFSERTGWVPEIPFEQTMEDLLNYWRHIQRERK
ncbi:GDP-mannose 4,6-dehydratase [Paenibacillus alkaliterrae]|uniref:GDP-mannose 4,6-dehydratase n=1 Tax=Paenibacillus alkaliterrae TaxID=320909 RepID=UPI001F254F11|nr:GDP-mannose 4,6-dehydratase [Paenibacillus alkaliterrae]MCF2941695.1 GDP-mannose 4,6-dehydratase [Paenibacillus alkaliterrae]